MPSHGLTGHMQGLQDGNKQGTICGRRSWRKSVAAAARSARLAGTGRAASCRELQCKRKPLAHTWAGQARPEGRQRRRGLWVALACRTQACGTCQRWCSTPAVRLLNHSRAQSARLACRRRQACAARRPPPLVHPSAPQQLCMWPGLLEGVCIKHESIDEGWTGGAACRPGKRACGGDIS